MGTLTRFGWAALVALGAASAGAEGVAPSPSHPESSAEPSGTPTGSTDNAVVQQPSMGPLTRGILGGVLVAGGAAMAVYGYQRVEVPPKTIGYYYGTPIQTSPGWKYRNSTVAGIGIAAAASGLYEVLVAIFRARPPRTAFDPGGVHVALAGDVSRRYVGLRLTWAAPRL